MTNYALARAAAVAIASMGCSTERPSEAQLPFEAGPDLQVPGVVQATGLSSADFDQDGRPDMVVLSGSTARIKILLNEGSGLREAQELDGGASASGLALGDFDRDGKLDLAVCHHDTDEVLLFFGKGTGSFQPPRQLRVPVVKPHAHKLLCVDANADRHVDLLLAQADDNHLWVLLGDGQGGFVPSRQSPVSTGNHPYGVVSADFDADGRIDFATPNWYGKTVSVFLGGEAGALAEAPTSPLSGFSAPTALAAADLTGDGEVDLAVGNDDSSQVQILAGDGKAGFTPTAVLEAQADCFAPILVDLTGDGKLDVIATASNDAPAFSYWINLGGGRFSPAHSLACSALASTICVADWNGDGAMDLAVGSWEEATIHVWHGKQDNRSR